MKPFDHMAVGPIDENGNGPVIQEPRPKRQTKSTKPREEVGATSRHCSARSSPMRRPVRTATRNGMISKERLESILLHAREHAKLPLDLHPYGLDDTIAMAEELLADAARKIAPAGVTHGTYREYSASTVEHVCIGPTCAKSIKVRELDIGRDNASGSDLGDWIVVDAYPPGDTGMHVACSVECLLAWNEVG